MEGLGLPARKVVLKYPHYEVFYCHTYADTSSAETAFWLRILRRYLYIRHLFESCVRITEDVCILGKYSECLAEL